MSTTAMITPAPTQSPSHLLTVEGNLPAGLEGCFLQVNPHPAGGPERSPMICGIRIAGGVATLYRGDCALTAPPPALEATTERYRVVVELPVVADRAAALLGSPDRVVWQPNRPTRIGLLPASGAGHWFDLARCRITKILGADEVGDLVVVDAVRDGRVCRLELDPATGAARSRWLTGEIGLTTVDGQRNVFATNVDTDGVVTVTRHDLSTWHTVQLVLGRDLRVSAPAYAADGWLLVFAEDPVHRLSRLLVLSADDLAIRAVVQVPLAMRAADRVCWSA